MIIGVFINTRINICKTQQGEFCICDDGEPSGETEPEDCNFNCTGDLKNCGGDKTALVYTGEKEIRKKNTTLKLFRIIINIYPCSAIVNIGAKLFKFKNCLVGDVKMKKECLYVNLFVSS